MIHFALTYTFVYKYSAHRSEKVTSKAPNLYLQVCALRSELSTLINKSSMMRESICKLKYRHVRNLNSKIPIQNGRFSNWKIGLFELKIGMYGTVFYVSAKNHYHLYFSCRSNCMVFAPKTGPFSSSQNT